MDDADLLASARDALVDAHVPYSGFRVGAALRTADGETFTGCNLEVANYSNSLHAEELAVAAAVQAGHDEFESLAVASNRDALVTPCGMCRQTLAEFCDADLRVVCERADGHETFSLGALLPATFSADAMA
ncbi:MAG: cytidine deaminase [Haloferacaceae archaeon]